jgi:Domain of unknown function (DUF1963)
MPTFAAFLSSRRGRIMQSDVVLLERSWPPSAAPAGWVSQIGGWPNLPADMPWPRIRFKDQSGASLDFLAQINLAELPAAGRGSGLPATGTLYFFALSQSHLPLQEFGPDAARVLYFAGDASTVRPRQPPDDAGWGQDELHHGRMTAVQFRRTDAPRSELFPRCPIKPKMGKIVGDDEVLGRTPPPESGFKGYDRSFPFRVEDGLLNINCVRNHWRENILPFSSMRQHFTAAAEAHLKLEKNPPKWMQGKARPRPGYVDNALSKSFWSTFESDYLHWRDRAAGLYDRLVAQGRPTMLDESQRSQVNGIVAEADAMLRKVHACGMFLANRQGTAAKMALTRLLLDHPEVAAACEDEVLAAHPSRYSRTSHRMLGPPNDVQGETMGRGQAGSIGEQILLLQLDSDEWGPRMLWWDAGNITFWMSKADAAQRRFDLACAEIEGH